MYEFKSFCSKECDVKPMQMQMWWLQVLFHYRKFPLVPSFLNPVAQAPARVFSVRAIGSGDVGFRVQELGGAANTHTFT